MTLVTRTLATLFFGSTGYVFGFEEVVETKGKRGVKTDQVAFSQRRGVAS
jgi:hypothetical protein